MASMACGSILQVEPDSEVLPFTTHDDASDRAIRPQLDKAPVELQEELAGHGIHAVREDNCRNHSLVGDPQSLKATH